MVPMQLPGATHSPILTFCNLAHISWTHTLPKTLDYPCIERRNANIKAEPAPEVGDEMTHNYKGKYPPAQEHHDATRIRDKHNLACNGHKLSCGKYSMAGL